MAADFWASTHGRHWILDKKTLQESRKMDLLFISEIELAKLRIWYANLMHNLGKRLNVKQVIMATAITYFKRFYTKNTYRHTDPNLVAATCMYLACKMEESPHHIKNVISEMRNEMRNIAVNCKKTASTIANEQSTFSYDNQKVAEMEFYLLEELDFNLIVFHPYRTLTTLAQELGQKHEAIRDAWTIVNDSYKTDLCLSHPPHMIAIAALYIPIAIKLGEFGFSGKLKKWFYSLNVDMEEIAVIVQEILSLYELWSTYSDDQIPKIYEKLKIPTAADIEDALIATINTTTTSTTSIPTTITKIPTATTASITTIKSEEIIPEIEMLEEHDDNNNQDVPFRATVSATEEIDQEFYNDDKDFEFVLNFRRNNSIVKQELQSDLLIVKPYTVAPYTL
ncbi:11959_t:CDS:2 [Ambispora gerdemannii]|uniref:11959_t:CDS:1 n=1 Tax=Ambispora gerdemannii TaxID=144530 RepID=A0A9N8WHK1_9GLOM|nr:11959_t:CDS:2 [Ambispora gerdemannii]